MPANILTPSSTASVVTTSSFPFQLTQITIPEGYGPGVNELDCECPFALGGAAGIGNMTSSELVQPVPTGSAALPPATGNNTSPGVVVELDSFLFKGLSPGMAITEVPDLEGYGVYNKDPVLRVYGLGLPIDALSFFSSQGGPLGNADTVKIWLTVCFPSGEIDPAEQFFMACAPNVDGDIATNITQSQWRSLFPLVAFISYGAKYPPNLVETKFVNMLNNLTSPTPRVERRQVAAYAPIGEVDYQNNIVAQYVTTNLVLTDICYNGTPAKFPLPLMG